jgi:hypothetical protein
VTANLASLEDEVRHWSTGVSCRQTVAHHVPLEGRRPRCSRLQTRIGASSLTLGGLLNHLAFVEDYTFTTKLRGEPPGWPWRAADRDDDADWEFNSAAADTPAQLYGLWEGAVARSRTRIDGALADGGLDQLVDVSDSDGRQASLRRLVCDLIEEYGRHTAHADLLRESVDGLVGEDPPAGWQPAAPQQVVAADAHNGTVSATVTVSPSSSRSTARTRALTGTR